MTLEDIAKIVTTFPNTFFECFLFGDGCRFSESFCFIDQGDYELHSHTLCSYTTFNYKIVKKATPAFKKIVKDNNLEEHEKKMHWVLTILMWRHYVINFLYYMTTLIV